MKAALKLRLAFCFCRHILQSLNEDEVSKSQNGAFPRTQPEAARLLTMFQEKLG
jgi:hypothetical protein